MRYLVVPLVISIFLLIAYLGQINPGRVTLFLTSEQSYELAMTSLILFSAAFGGLLVIIVFGVRETKNLLVNWKSNRLQRKESKIDELYTDAVNAYLAKRHRDATALFQKILTIQPNHVNALLSLGKIHRKEGNYPEAIRLHRKARGLDEQNIDVLLSLSRELEESHRVDEAVQYLKEALRIDESNLTALSRLRNLFVSLNDWEEAHRNQEKLLKLARGDEERRREMDFFLGIKYELGRRHLERRERDAARRYFKGAIKLSKGFLPAYIGLGEIHLRESKPEQAASLWEKSYRVTQNVILLHKLEDLYLEMGNPGKIIGFYRSQLEGESQSTVLRFYLGKLYYRLEMVDHAMELLADLDAQVDYFPDLHKILGNLYLRRGNLEKAVELFKKGLNLKKRVLVPYYCPSCDHHTQEWSGRCGRCGRWNTYTATPIIIDRADRKSLPQNASFYLYPSEGNHEPTSDGHPISEGAADQPLEQPH